MRSILQCCSRISRSTAVTAPNLTFFNVAIVDVWHAGSSRSNLYLSAKARLVMSTCLYWCVSLVLQTVWTYHFSNTVRTLLSSAVSYDALTWSQHKVPQLVQLGKGFCLRSITSVSYILHMTACLSTDTSCHAHAVSTIQC